MEPIEKDSPTVNSEEEIEGISNDEYQKIFKVQSRKSKAKEAKKQTTPSAPAPAPVPPATSTPQETPKPEPVKEAPKENPTEKPEEKKEVKKRGRKELPAELKKPKPPHPFTQIKMVKEEVENLKKQLSSQNRKDEPKGEVKTPQEPKINPEEFERKHNGGSTGYSKKEIEELRREVEELKRPKHGIDALSEKQRKLWEMMRN